jgi:hypothetical protein
MHLAVLVASILALSPAAIAAAPKPLPADQHQPPVFLDVPATWIHVASHDAGYQPRAYFRVAGATSKADRLRFEWKSGGKRIAVGACDVRWYQDEQEIAGGCSVETDLTASGPIDIDIIYTDDQQDRGYLVATLKVEVRRWQGIGRSQYWGIVPDDVLSTAFVRHWDSASARRTPFIQFWSSNSGLNGNATLRCTVDGKRLPDFEAHLDPANQGSPQTQIEASYTSSNGQHTYTFQHYQVDPGFRFGPKTKEDQKLTPDQVRFAVDHPGKYDCLLRKDGKQLRQFMFTVDEKGMIQQSDMQSGKRALKTLSNVVLIDMKLPADNGVEERLRPEAMRRSIRFGLPWPDHTRAKELQAAFPAASGQPD